ncbi:hypothetical protein HOLleu_25872 [Holothuria leucospilota]|uniref:Uncharacterized protein n=1 Tax=Holothuria leucospilota TaxID=206669 RepID=A0A9Q1BTM7_HOLLE|nr:hypothetical protein HOLleu_25872 [Holothuria leucospilota]
MADVNKLKLARRNNKGQLTRTLTTIDSLLQGETCDSEMLQKYAEKAEKQFAIIEEKHAQLIEITEGETEFENEEKWMAECEQDFVQVLLRVRRVVDRQSPLDNCTSNASVPTTPQSNPTSTVPTQPVSTGTSQSSQSDPTATVPTQPVSTGTPQSSQSNPTTTVPTQPASTGTSQSSQSNPTTTVPTQPASTGTSPGPVPTVQQPTSQPSLSSAPRMERMKFPKFSGDIKDYKRFKKLFTHCTANLTEIECFYQLTESMSHAPERNKIKGCINIERAWQVLDDCYGDNDKVVDRLLQDLNNLRPYEHKGKTNLQEMDRFVQTLQTFETQAEGIGLSGELNSKIMQSQIKQKLPEEHRIAYYKSVRDDNTDDTLAGLVKWLHRQLLLLEKAKPFAADNPPRSPQAHCKTFKSSNAASSDGVEKVKGAQSDSPKCALHTNSNTHFLKACNKFRELPLKEKYEIMRKNAICYRCGHNNCKAGKPPYNSNSCQFVAPCRIQGCGSDSHFAAICPVVYGGNEGVVRNPLNGGAEPFQPVRSSTNIATVGERAENELLGTLPTVMGTDKDKYQDHDLTVVGGGHVKKKLRLLDCHISDIEGNWSCPLTVIEIDNPCADAPVVLPEQFRQYDHLKDIDIQEAPSETIDVLLGVDNSHLMVWQEYILGEISDEPIAVKCPFGWFVQGGKTMSLSSHANFVNVTASGPLEEFIGLDTVGLEPKRCKCSSDFLNKTATELMQKSVTQLPDGSYEIQLPWKKSPNDLPDNFSQAVKRLNSLEKQFQKRPKEWDTYCRQMEDQLERGVSRRVSEAELEEDRKAGRKMWFLPHFAVKKDSKTTPVRVVYDGKARYQGYSLNDYLVKGENINSSLFDVALRFHENEVGVIADISKMFQAIKLRPDDARFHRFVFRERPSYPIEVFELTTVTFGDKPSPTAAIVTLRHVVEEYAPGNGRLIKLVSDQFYMDDLNESVDNIEEALELKSSLTETFGKGRFAIRKWQSNAKEVCDDTEDKTMATALGTKWDLSKDTLKVKEVVTSQEVIPTKRNLLARTASYYDVFGMLSGILVRPKILLQKLWQLDVDWDTPLDRIKEVYTTLSEIDRDLKEVDSMEIPRCLIPDVYKGPRPLPEVSLHGASDASEDAMGIGVWLRWAHSSDADAHLSFVCARARLTPLKQSSIPRKELQAILLLSRLMLTVKKALRYEIAYSKIWTDSMTAISWLRGQSKAFRSYVAYRVGEITTEFDPIHDIRYVPSNQNVTDLVSRGGKVAEMKKVINGPDYLKRPPTEWPKTPENVPVNPGDKEQKRFHARNAKVLSVGCNAVPGPPVVGADKFSSWPKLQMVTARVLSLRDLPRKYWLKELTQQISKWPSSKHIKAAELYWIREAQKGINLDDPNILKLD